METSWLLMFYDKQAAAEITYLANEVIAHYMIKTGYSWINEQTNGPCANIACSDYACTT